MEPQKQKLNIPTGWAVKWNEFYDIDPLDISNTKSKELSIFLQEDMLWIEKQEYNIDLGWYGGENMNDEGVGFQLHLFRGNSWNKCELLEKYRSKGKEDVVEILNAMIASVDNGSYDQVVGYKIDEDDLSNANSMTDHEVYSAKK